MKTKCVNGEWMIKFGWGEWERAPHPNEVLSWAQSCEPGSEEWHEHLDHALKLAPRKKGRPKKDPRDAGHHIPGLFVMLSVWRGTDETRPHTLARLALDRLKEDDPDAYKHTLGGADYASAVEKLARLWTARGHPTQRDRETRDWLREWDRSKSR